jgi:hypothetical protein
MKNMTNHQSCSLSSELISYLTGDLPITEMKEMEKHLTECPLCHIELKELQEAWAMIPFKYEEVDVPSDLKEEVLNAIFHSENLSLESDESIVTMEERPRKSNLRSLKTFAVAAALILTFGVVIWNNIILRGDVATLKTQTQTQTPIKISQVYTLKSANPLQASAEGSAMLYGQGDKKGLVIQLHGLPETKGTEAYQVWLIHNGAKKSCGVFHVDEKGNGFLSYNLDDKDLSFDAIGVSLEPDANGTQPRGKKVLGT